MTRELNKKIFCTVIAAILIVFCLLGADTEAKSSKQGPPMYRRSGVIGGTSLTYENLDISKSGRVSVVVINEGKNTLAFSANFSFFNEKDSSFEAGFTIEGSVGSMSKNTYETDFPEYKNLKRTSYMKVLGRAGMAVAD